MNKKTIAAFLGGIALTAAIFTTAPAIRDAVTPKVDAAGTCPITLQSIQSTGNLVFLPFQFHSSDLVNLRSEINDLGAWADGEISSIQTEVSSGKSSLRDKMVSKGASSSLPSVPSFAQLKDAVDEIYDKGWADHRDHMNSTTILIKDNPAKNGGYSTSETIPHDGTMYISYRLKNMPAHGMIDSRNADVKLNGTRLPGSTSSDSAYEWHGTMTVSAGDTLSVFSPNWQGTDEEDEGHIVAVLFY